MFDDLDTIALTRALPEFVLKAGDAGTVVHVYTDGKSYEVEFVTLSGEPIAVVTLEADAIRPIRAREIAQARDVA